MCNNFVEISLKFCGKKDKQIYVSITFLSCTLSDFDSCMVDIFCYLTLLHLCEFSNFKGEVHVATHCNSLYYYNHGFRQ